jgi:hypothetical protein
MPYLIVVLAALTRFIPHAWNFSPVYGALLFGGANMKKRHSIWFSALTLGASDIVLTKLIYHLHVGWDELFQMAAFASIAVIGWILQRRFSIRRLTFAGLAAPIAFYLISDFGVWLGFNSYPHTFTGLVACYLAAIPFQGRIMASTALFAGVLFGTQRLHMARAGHPRQTHPNLSRETGKVWGAGK